MILLKIFENTVQLTILKVKDKIHIYTNIKFINVLQENTI